MPSGMREEATTVVVERGADGWRRETAAWAAAAAEVDASAEEHEVQRIWDRVRDARIPLDGVLARATRAERTVERDGVAVRHRSTTSSLSARIHADDGTFVVVRRSIVYDVRPFLRSRDLDVEVAAFAEDVAAVRRGAASNAHGTVLLRGPAAGTLLHEAVGHLREADNAERLGRTSAAEQRLGLAVVDLGRTPGSDHPHLDDRLQAMRAASVLGGEGRASLLGVEDRALDHPPHVARARRSHPGAPHLARMTHLDVRATTLPRLDGRDWDVEVDEVVAAFVDLAGGRATLHLGASRVRRGTSERRAYGGRIDLDLSDLGDVVVGVAGPVETEVAMCDKRGQRLPVATTSPGLVLTGVSVRDAVG